MRKAVLLFTVILIAAPLCSAQYASKVEVFGGYSYFRWNPPGGGTGFNMHGWETQLTYNFNDSFGIKGDVSGHYCCNGGSLYNFMAGPQVATRNKMGTAFMHAMVGGSHTDGETGAAWDIGGGLDWNATPRLAVRVLQLDYLGTHLGGATEHNFRGSAGIVFKFGGK